MCQIKGVNDMSNVGQKERRTQNRLVAFFKNELDYEYLGNW